VFAERLVPNYKMDAAKNKVAAKGSKILETFETRCTLSLLCILLSERPINF